ncbi:T-cell surface glycoprotein CD4-like [Micropterus dolomieu]|uniref:T-cell surface glycoprotein CD4-like n=1 Tax=Micropterus dolomieu TaxID=147949 RepID=UPI001E8D678E|nr:T-cell surface glycoprotein CD4-like [Micropterus dolomieu]XP_045901256.1 T-cell surface glycoprotein CD4-like [Micropterus dolomieu]
MKNSIQSVLILIAVLMSTTGADEVVYVQVGKTVTLKAPAGNNVQKFYLYWYFGDDFQLAWRNNKGGKGFTGDDKWKNNLSWSGDSLVIENIQQVHLGSFVCKVIDKIANRNIETIRYKLLKLNVSMNPPSPLLPGESMSLFCDAESPQSHKKPGIAWLNPQEVKMNSHQGLFKGKATGQYNGQWTCVVTNEGKEHRVTVSVTVVDLSPAPLHPQYTSTSTPLTVPCSIPKHISWDQIKAKGIQGVHWDFIPKYGSSLFSGGPQRLFSLSLDNQLTWKKDQDRELTPVPDVKNGNLSLTRNRGKEEDAGDYVCTLNFTNGVTLKRTVHVNVLQIISSPGTDLISGQQVNLTCSLSYPVPSDLQVKWLPPEQSQMFPLRSDHYPANLSWEVGTGDGGKWRCELQQNGTWLTSAVIMLKIEPKLSVWMKLTICSATVIIILLTIFVFIFYRRRQRKMRHHRHRLCQCKNPKPKGFYRT